MMQAIFQGHPRRGAIALAVACSLTMLAGCAVGPDYVRPTTTLPANYTAEPLAANEGQALVTAQDIPAQWWELFHSAELNTLVESSLQRNPSINAAQATLRGALESVYAQQGAFYPTVDASFSPSRQKVAGVLASPLASNDYYYNLHTAQVTVSYGPDLWGGNRRQVESLKAQAESQRFQLEATRLTLTSNVANAVIQEAALRGQIKATREIIETQVKLLAMLNKQLQLGQVAVADVAAQEAALAVAEQGLPALEKQLAVQRDLLTALAGRYPDEGSSPSFELADLQLPASLPLTLPSTLVERRPDVRAAEELLHAASADIGVAVANRLPSLTLGVNAYGSSANSLSDLFKSGTGFWTLAGNVTQPVFDGGTLKHRQAAAQAAYDAAAAQYRSTVINAFQNVADALQAIHYDADAERKASAAERAAKKSLDIARRQVELGDISPMALLASEQSYQQARLALVQAEAGRLSDTVALFQALGGGWWRSAAPVTSSGTR